MCDRALPSETHVSKEKATAGTWNNGGCCRGTSLMKNSDPLGPYSRNIPRALWWS